LIARVTRVLLICGLVAHAVWHGYTAGLAGESAWGGYVKAAACAVAAMGLWRGVMWGLGWASVVWMIECLRWTIRYFLSSGELRVPLLLDSLVGSPIPLPVHIVLALVFAVGMLAPLVVLGRRGEGWLGAGPTKKPKFR